MVQIGSETVYCNHSTSIYHFRDGYTAGKLSFPRSILAHSATVLSYSMALIITSIKLINPSYFTTVCPYPGSATC